jgi:hypothetical protein
VSGDFNGDGARDQAVLLVKEQKIAVLVLVSKKNSVLAFKVYEGLELNQNSELGLEVFEPGKHLLSIEDAPLCGTDSIMCRAFGEPILRTSSQLPGISFGDIGLIFQWVGYGFRTLHYGD